MIGVELLDDAGADPAAVRAELRDIARLNALFGGRRAVLEALRRILGAAGKREAGREKWWTLLDVGTGLGDIPRAARALARRHGIELTLLGVERIPEAARLARGEGVITLLADGGALPLAERSVDVVMVSQVLHHLPRQTAVAWIAALHRVARRAVVIADLRRSRAAMAGMWAVSFPLGLRAQTRRDAVLSLRRGYTRREMDRMLGEAGVAARSYYAPIGRVVAWWETGTP